MPRELAGVVLCGGRSRRMGRAKALLPWRSVTLIEHVVSVLAEVTDDIVIVTSADSHLPEFSADVAPRVVRDREPHLGPLAGIREALEIITKPLAYVTSTDAPFLTPEFVRAMASHGKCAAPEVDGFVQSLSAVYETRLADAANRLLREERRRPLFLLQAGDFVAIREDDLVDRRSLENLNTPESYLTAVAADHAERGATPAPVVVELYGLARQRAGVDHLEAGYGLLGEVLRAAGHACPNLGLVREGRSDLPAEFLVSIGGRDFVRDPGVPIGPGEHVVVMDAAAGG
ncbi:MAG: molybdenum cofactor guanylyltransferase [Planctomycetes bacterium]|nr:molybdenum cofactor guanylyltransferase [Planctomycetota bacterium]